MNKKIFLLGVVLLLIGQLCAAQQVPGLITVKADGTEAPYALTGVQKIVFTGNTMTVNMKGGASDVTDIVCIRFDLITSIVNPKTISASIAVFPNPAKTTLTVTGVEAGSKIDLYSVNGALLKSIPAQNNSMDIDVSFLQKGIYLLKVGAQTTKFVKN